MKFPVRIRRPLAGCLALLFIAAGCAHLGGGRKTRTQEIIDDTGRLRERYEFFVDPDRGIVKHGGHIVYGLDDRKLSRANFHDGKLHGKVTHWYPNGKKKSVRHYVHGQEGGTARFWYENGNKAIELPVTGVSTVWNQDGNKVEERHYLDGRMHGLVMLWDGNGVLRRSTTYREGVQQGVERLWHGNGQLATLRHYDNGSLTGPAHFWSSRGSAVASGVFNNGVHWNGTFLINGVVQEYRSGKPVK